MRRRVLRRLIWVYTVCSGLSVRIYMVNTVVVKHIQKYLSGKKACYAHLDVGIFMLFKHFEMRLFIPRQTKIGRGTKELSCQSVGLLIGWSVQVCLIFMNLHSSAWHSFFSLHKLRNKNLPAFGTIVCIFRFGPMHKLKYMDLSAFGTSVCIFKFGPAQIYGLICLLHFSLYIQV